MQTQTKKKKRSPDYADLSSILQYSNGGSGCVGGEPGHWKSWPTAAEDA